jgi:retron-type reverse transcriptase
VRYTSAGTPQGGVISPLLSNSYFHEVLDGWFEETVQPLLKEKSFMARYASDQRSADAIIGCETKEDAGRIMKGKSASICEIWPDPRTLVRYTRRRPVW